MTRTRKALAVLIVGAISLAATAVPAMAATPPGWVSGPVLTAHAWELVAPLAPVGGLIEDTAQLTLVPRPAGMLTGTWAEESMIPGGIALNGTEPFGKRLVYDNSFPVTGSFNRAGFTVEVHDAQHLVLHGGLGPEFPAGPQVSCVAGSNADALWLRWNGKVMIFWPKGDYPASAHVGGHCK